MQSTSWIDKQLAVGVDVLEALIVLMSTVAAYAP